MAFFQALILEMERVKTTAKELGESVGVFEGTLQEELDRFNAQLEAIPEQLEQTERVVKERIENLSTIVNTGLYGENGILSQISGERIAGYIDQQFADARDRLGFDGSGVHNESFLTGDQVAVLGAGYSPSFGSKGGE
jgi:hypothetical protein